MKNGKQFCIEFKSRTARLNRLLYGFMCALFTLVTFTALPTATRAAGTHLDWSFAGKGMKAFGASLSNFDEAYATAIQPDGKIVVAGYTSASFSSDFLVARLNQDGTPDNTFGTNGIRTIDFGGHNDVAYAVAIQADGRIVVAGE